MTLLAVRQRVVQLRRVKAARNPTFAKPGREGSCAETRRGTHHRVVFELYTDSFAEPSSLIHSLGIVHSSGTFTVRNVHRPFE